MSDQITTLSEMEVYALCGPNIFQRGKSYYREGRVLRPRIEGETLRAEVRGSQREPYEVAVTLVPENIAAECDCPYDGEYCKHVAAVLIAWAVAPRLFHAAPAPEGTQAPVAGEPYEAGEDLDAAAELRALLEGRTVAELRHIARRRGITLRGSAKADLVPQLASALIEPEGLRAAIGALEADQLVALDLVHLAGAERFVTMREIGNALSGLRIELDDVVSCLRELAERGLVSQGMHGTFEEAGYRVPAAILPFLPEAEYLCHRASSQEVTREAEPARLPPDELLYLIWRYLRRNAVSRRPVGERVLIEKTSDLLRGWHNVREEIVELQARPNWQWEDNIAVTVLPPPPELADAELDAISVLTGGDREAVEFGLQLLRELRMVAGRDRFTAHEDGLRQFLMLGAVGRRRRLARAWLGSSDGLELVLLLRHRPRLSLRRRLGHAGLRRPAELFGRLVVPRRVLIQLLLRLEEGVWYALPSLEDTFRRLAAQSFVDHVELRNGPAPRWWMEDDYGRHLDPRSAADWALAYGHFVREAVCGPLTWLGALTVVGSGKGAVFRIAGLRGLFGAADLATEPPRPVEVTADLTITVPPGHGDLSVHDYLLTIAEPGEPGPGGLRYQMTPARACAAFGSGHSAEEIIAFLDRTSQGRLPETAAATLRDWDQRYGLVHLYADLALIELADDYTLPELLATTGLARHLVYRFSPRVVAVDPGALDGLVDEMVRRGYTPKVVEGTS